MISNEVLFFVSFLIFIILILIIDLGLFNKKSHIISSKEALGWTLLWVTFATGFYFLLRTHGHLLHDIKTQDQLQTVVEKFEHTSEIEGGTFEEHLANYRKNMPLSISQVT